MNAPVFDLAARRAARPRDARAVIDNVVDGAATLHAEVSGWPFRYLRTPDIEGIERQLVAMQALLIELRGLVPPKACLSMRTIPEAKRWKQTGKGAAHTFVAMPHYMMESEQWGALSSHAVKLLMEFARQYKGNNNGDFSAPWSRMRRRGWRSQHTLSAAIAELIEAGFVVRTRTPNRHHVCALYAITWRAIDECDGKLEVSAERVASNAWKNAKTIPYVHMNCSPCAVVTPENTQKAA